MRCCHSILDLHHDFLVPTSLTTGATRRSSCLASMSSSAEPPPSLRALSGESLLPEMTQSSSPHCRVALATVLDPPHRRSAPKSSRPPPPMLRAPIVPLFSCGPRHHRICHGARAIAYPWATPSVVPAGRRILCKWAAR
jgi:hypothetical protein